jgi:hypothetical protein
MKVTIPVEEGNTTIQDGTLPKTFESVLSELKPEAAYFLEDRGERTGLLVFDLKDPSQIPAIAEPFFLAFNARVELHPAMNMDDLKRAMSGIDRTVQRYYRPERIAA